MEYLPAPFKKEISQAYTAFNIPFVCFKWLVMPISLTAVLLFSKLW